MSSYLRQGLNFFFKKNLFLTNCLTSGFVMLSGDLIQQELEYETFKKKSHKPGENRYNWSRAGRMFTVGCIMGTMHHWYYGYIDKLMPDVTLLNATKKVLCDQLIASPVTIVFFFFAMGILEKKTFDEITEEITQKGLYVYSGDCLFWPPIQMVNFYYVPARYRVMYINVATMIFNVFLSYMKHDF